MRQDISEKVIDSICKFNQYFGLPHHNHWEISQFSKNVEHSVFLDYWDHQVYYFLAIEKNKILLESGQSVMAGLSGGFWHSQFVPPTEQPHFMNSMLSIACYGSPKTEIVIPYEIYRVFDNKPITCSQRVFGNQYINCYSSQNDFFEINIFHWGKKI